MLNRGVPGQSVCIKVDREYLRQRSDVGVACARCARARGKNARARENTGSHVGAHKSIPGGWAAGRVGRIDRYLNEYSSAVRDPL